MIFAMFRQVTYANPVASVIWFSGGTPGDSGYWDVGFYDPKRPGIAPVVEIDGVPIFFGQPHVDHRLDGAVLDHREGHFVVDESAI